MYVVSVHRDERVAEGPAPASTSPHEKEKYVKTILVTGGAGFVGSSLAFRYKHDNPEDMVICLDNLKRRGSELSIPRLKEAGIEFVHGDIRNKEDLFAIADVDMIFECSAEPSVLAGYGASPEYVINTNLVGTINCLELARLRNADFLFLSTSRVYPIETVNALPVKESETRFEWVEQSEVHGASVQGISEELPLPGARSMYGATKLCSEMIIQEYAAMYGVRAVIDRCGVLTGPWQMGKVDQGFMVLWVANHYFKKKLGYFGFGGTGKQVRDILHVDDLYDLVKIQMSDMDKYAGEVFNVGGGLQTSVSLQELTALCVKHTGNEIPITPVSEDRVADIRIYYSNNSKATAMSGWTPTRSVEDIVIDIVRWLKDNEDALKGILG